MNGSEFNIEPILENLDPSNFNSNAELFRYLEANGFGSFNRFRSQHTRDSFGFRQAVEEWKEGDKLVQTLPDEVEFDEEEDEQAYIDYRRLTFDNATAEYNKQTAKHTLKVGNGKWACNVCFSDTHLEGDGTNVGLLFDTVDFFNKFSATEYIFVGDLGDYFESAGDWGKRIAMGNDLRISHAFTTSKILLNRIKPKIWVLGNHDWFVIRSLGYDLFEPMVKDANPNCLYRGLSATVKLFLGDDIGTQTDWIKFIHQTKGNSKLNLHHGPFNHLRDFEPTSSTIVSGHYHFSHASHAMQPFSNGIKESILLGSIKAYDDYSMSLGHKSDSNENPFAFLFMYDGHTEWITNLELAKYRAVELHEKYG